MSGAEEPALTDAERLVIAAQELLAATLPPGGLSDRDCINRLLEQLDGPKGQMIAARARGKADEP